MFSLSAVDNCGWPSWCLPATDPNPGAGPPYQSATGNVSSRAQNRLPSHFSDGLSAFGSNYCQEHVPQPTNSDIYHSGVLNDALEADYAVHSLYHDRDSEARAISIREPSAFPIQDNESSSTQGPIVSQFGGRVAGGGCIANPTDQKRSGVLTIPESNLAALHGHI